MRTSFGLTSGGREIPGTGMPSGERYVLDSSGGVLAREEDVGPLSDLGLEVIGAGGHLRSLGSVVPLGGGPIPPGPTFLMALHPGFFYYRLDIRGLQVSEQESFTALFSFDGGSTYLADIINQDSYLSATASTFGDMKKPVPPVGEVFKSSVMFITDVSSKISSPTNPNSPTGANVTLLIHPGSDQIYPTLTGQCWNCTGPGSSFSNILEVSNFFVTINPEATIRVPKGRITNIAIQPYGNGDYPPTSLHRLAEGAEYRLWGTL